MSIDQFKTYEAHAGLQQNNEINKQLSAEKGIDNLLGRINKSTRGINNPIELMIKVRGDKELSNVYERTDSLDDKNKDEMLSIFKKYLPS
nr:hypothetical protein [Candidatus Gracilibacteria bacterium]